jgi:hypothetical protein
MANPLRGDSDQPNTPGVAGFSAVSDGTRGDTRASAKNGVVGGNESTEAIPGGQPGGNGVFGFSTNPNGSGVFGANNSTNPANAPGGSGVFGLTGATGAAGVFGANNAPRGVGVQGNGPDAGVSGFSANGSGVVGSSRQGDAILGNGGIGGNAIHGRGGTFAGLFEGGVSIRGGSLEVTKIGDIGGEISAVSIFAQNKHFRIDHPADPVRKYLIHATIESSEMMNLYSGVVVLDGRGEAEVALPEWFEALNRDFRYQLTCVGSFAPVYIARKIANNGFKIAGGHPGIEVCWQVAGTRHDRWAREHPFAVEVEKQPGENEAIFYRNTSQYKENDAEAVMP